MNAHPELVAAVQDKFPFFDPHRSCWACGDACSLERAHVVAEAAGGTNDPSNFWLLCRECHADQPDGASPGAQRLWLVDHHPRITRIVQRVQELLRPLTTRAHFDEWYAARSGLVTEIASSTASRLGRANSFLPSIACELLADYERWIAKL